MPDPTPEGPFVDRFDRRARVVVLGVLVVGLCAVWGALALLGRASDFPQELQLVTTVLLTFFVGDAIALKR